MAGMANAGPARRRLRLTHRLHLGKHFARKSFCDGQLTKDGDTTIPIHRTILAAVSTKFKRMFQQKDNSSPYVVPVVDLATLARVVDFIYEGAVEFDKEEELGDFRDALAFLRVDSEAEEAEFKEEEVASKVMDRTCHPAELLPAGSMADRLHKLTQKPVEAKESREPVEAKESRKPTCDTFVTMALPNGAFTKPCHYYQKGSCPRGNSCTFLHQGSREQWELRERRKEFLETAPRIQHTFFLEVPTGNIAKADMERYFNTYGEVKRVTLVDMRNKGSTFEVQLGVKGEFEMTNPIFNGVRGIMETEQEHTRRIKAREAKKGTEKMSERSEKGKRSEEKKQRSGEKRHLDEKMEQTEEKAQRSEKQRRSELKKTENMSGEKVAKKNRREGIKIEKS